MNAMVASDFNLELPGNIEKNKDGGLVSTAEAENVEEDPLPLHMVADKSHKILELEALGVGKRKKFPNKLYSSATFWRHNDNDNDGISMP
jgi:hypothetical protein